MATGGFYNLIERRYGVAYKRGMKGWIKNKLKLTMILQQRKFLLKCRQYDVLPPHIYNIKCTTNIKNFQLNKKSRNFKKSYQRRLLNLEISDIHSEIVSLKRKIQAIELFLNNKLPHDLSKNFYDSNNNKFNRHGLEAKKKLINKFKKINGIQNETLNKFLNIDKSKWIVNESSVKIPDRILNVLSLGDKFSVPINCKDYRDRRDTTLNVIKNFESSCYMFPDNSLDKLRAVIVNLIGKYLYSSKHINYIESFILREINTCKKFLKDNGDLFVTKADKGQVTVIMDKQTYINKMNMTLDDDNTYKQIKKDPLRIITTKTNNMLKLWLDNKIIDEYMYKSLKCTNGNLPRCYGLPKIHKKDSPLRIVVSSVGGPLYNIARYLHEILNSSIKKPTSNIKDSWSFVTKINKTDIDSGEVLMSLDVTSLFTNIPKELVVQGITNRWNEIKNSTKMNLTQFLDAVEMVLGSAYFKFDGKFYEQVYGSPMGSPLSPILADIIMDDLEIYCLTKLDFKINSYFRYVDDIFLIVPRNKVDLTLEIFNGYHPRLKFTHELENNNSLSFLNTSVIRGKGGELLTNWYRKPTYSGRCINFLSSHPEQHKINTITNLVDQAILLSDETFHESNLVTIKNILLNNCYPIKLINRKINERLHIIKKNNITTRDKSKVDIVNVNKVMVVPYIKEICNGIKRVVGKNCDLRYTIPKKLTSIIKKGKDKLDTKMNTDVVYKLDCNDCDKVYIGQTKRHLLTRIKEHKNNIKNSSGNYSVVTNHRLSENHDFKWDDPIILHKEKNRRRREIAEMFFIKKFKKKDITLNLQKDTDNLNPIYDKIIT